MTNDIDPSARVRRAIEESDLVRAAASIRRDGGRSLALGATTLRGLREEEIVRLERQGNVAEDWSRVKVAERFEPSQVWHSSFYGDVLLGSFTRPAAVADGIDLPSGICRSTLVNCVIGNEVIVRDVCLLANYVVCEGAILLGCGSITMTGSTTFGNGASLSVGIETGGRAVPVYAEIDLDVASAVAGARDRRAIVGPFSKAVAEYAVAVTSTVGIIERFALIRNTSQVHNTYLGPGARVEGATLVADSTLLSSLEEPVRIESGACVRSSLIQWGSRVSTMALVENSVMTEYSWAEKHGKVHASILGPNTGVAEGEVNACLLGPFVGFHHQALLIAALWPEGRGNVAHGANVGSNHTSRAPDQEFWPGEGAYFGLGVNIKYPADFRRSPYTIIASGVTTLPQRLAFPFSLINKPWVPCAEVSPGYNEIIPAWVLTDNLYMLLRNEAKFQARNRARRSRFEFAVFRPETVDGMRDACRQLEGITQIKNIYTERELEWLGKNFLEEKHRQPAIEAYHFFIAFYALLGLKDKALALVRDKRRNVVVELLRTPSDERPWSHQRQILVDDMGLDDVREALSRLPEMLERVAQGVERSKAKDDRRGQHIIDDYASVHVPADRDEFVLQTWARTKRTIEEVREVNCSV